jgi:hypothetical protein
MTITLTRKEAQQILDALEQLDGWDTATQGDIVFDPSDEIEILRARLSAPECVCGEPYTAGVHRQDGPCYQQPDSELKLISTGVTHIYSTGAPDAIQYDKDGNEMAHWKFSSFLPAPEPEPVACIVKDCENHKHQGRFVGDICSQCHAFITRNEGKYSQAYRNAQREWQGLTDEEIEAGFMANTCCDDLVVYEHVARAIEAKLREKNHG